ncbi:MAG: hypothetical protein ACOYOI_04130 [Chthoniobacterales bacterium]
MAATSLNEPRYRYQEVAPEHLTVLVSELLEKLPAEFRREGETRDGSIDLPCRDLLAGNTPRLSLGQLNQLLPDLVVIPEGMDDSHRLSLPAGWVARHYRLVTKREEIPQERVEWVEKGKEVQGAQKAAALSASDNLTRAEFKGPGSEKPAIIEAELSKEAYPSKASPKRSLFASLPMFRRHQPEAAVQQQYNPPPSTSVEKENGEPLKSPKALEPAEPSVVSEQAGNASALTLESLWKLDPEDQLADPSALQALFMTEEKLTLDRVIEMAGEFPGLRACVLAHGEHVVCASQTPTGMDLRTLSGQAMTMLAQIRESSSNMGLGAVPAITLHAEQGTLSFLHNEELCLLVLHADRGFVPGVRERLQEMLGHLATSRPALLGRAEGGNLRPET